MLKIIKKKINLLFLIAVILFSLPSVFGLLHVGFPLTDDGNWMVIRFSAFYEVLRSGELPVRFLTRLNYGFGYPVADFLYPLFMYLGVPLRVLGISFVDTIKIIFGFSLIFSSIFTYLWLRKIFDNLSSLVGATFYTFFPYHLYDVYKRGSVGETLALSIFPFILWQIERKNLLLTSIGIALLILSHNTLSLLLIPLMFAYAILRNRKLLKFILTSLIIGFSLSSFFWIPAIYDTKYTVFAATSVSDFYNYFINLGDLGIIGIASLVLLFSLSFLIFINKETRKEKLLLYSLTASLLVIFLISPFSKNLWELIPLTNIIQFPFRLLSLLMILLSFQLGFLLNSLNKSYKSFVAVIFLILIFISAKPYLSVDNYQYLPDSFYSTNMDTTTVRNEYMPKWVKEVNLEYKAARVENLTGSEKINVFSVSPREIVFDAFLVEQRVFRVNLVYFPGWSVYVNGLKTEINYEDNGLIEFNLGKGQNSVKVVFEETMIRAMSNLLSIISLLGLLAFTYLIRIKKIKYEIY